MSYHYAAENHYSTASSRRAKSSDESLLWKCLLLIGLTYLVWSEKLSINLNLSPSATMEQAASGNGQKIKASLLPDVGSIAIHQNKERPKPKSQVMLPVSAKGHAIFAIDPDFSDRNQVDNATVSESMAQCKDYIARFAPVAVAEMHKFGIPASIILAQGLLESDAGASKLASATNNHFGIKCFSKRCQRGHCANFSDDSHKDFFVRYGNVWSSFRAHSNFLKNSRRYASLFQLGPDDYRAWANGLEKAGYATDKKYAEKLIALIQNLQLHTYDGK